MCSNLMKCRHMEFAAVLNASCLCSVRLFIMMLFFLCRVPVRPLQLKPLGIGVCKLVMASVWDWPMES